MSWHEDLQLEIAVEFLRFSVCTWDIVEAKTWQRRQAHHREWALHGKWFQKTTAGRKANKARWQRYKTTTVALRHCVVCGKAFDLTVAGAYKNQRLCSKSCQPTAVTGLRNKKAISVTIDGRTACIKDWAAEYSISEKAVYARTKRGWDPVRALTTPAKKNHLTAEHVAEIRQEHVRGESPSGLAERFGLSTQAIYDILNRRRWAHVPNEGRTA